jgi:hypothetical protein
LALTGLRTVSDAPTRRPRPRRCHASARPPGWTHRRCSLTHESSRLDSHAAHSPSGSASIPLPRLGTLVNRSHSDRSEPDPTLWRLKASTAQRHIVRLATTQGLNRPAFNIAPGTTKGGGGLTRLRGKVSQPSPPLLTVLGGSAHPVKDAKNQRTTTDVHPIANSEGHDRQPAKGQKITSYVAYHRNGCTVLSGGSSSPPRPLARSPVFQSVLLELRRRASRGTSL